MQKMVWNVYYENINGSKIQQFNIFDHDSFNEDVKKIYKTGEIEIPALTNVNFEVEKGEFCVIVGASGSGKRRF